MIQIWKNYPDTGMIDIVNQHWKLFYRDRNHEHVIFPGMLYISHPTEYRTLYSRKELESLASICQEDHILLYLLYKRHKNRRSLL